MKLMEAKVEIRCLKSDVKSVQSVMGPAVSKFKALIQKECGKNVECELVINESKPLDNFDKDRFFIYILASEGSF